MNILIYLIFLYLINLLNGFVVLSPKNIAGVYGHIPAHFGTKISDSKLNVQKSYKLVLAQFDEAACTPLHSQSVKNKIVLILRG